jgi:hypothetical protein
MAACLVGLAAAAAAAISATEAGRPGSGTGRPCSKAPSALGATPFPSRLASSLLSLHIGCGNVALVLGVSGNTCPKEDLCGFCAGL